MFLEQAKPWMGAGFLGQFILNPRFLPCTAVRAVYISPDIRHIPTKGDFAMMETSPIHLGKLTIRYLIDGSQTETMGMFELTVLPGANVPPPHSHSNNEEIVYILEGKLRYSVGGNKHDLLAGESMRTPKGIVHAFANPFSEVARALIVLSPDIGAQYFLDVGEVLNNGAPPDKVALVAVMKRYGLVPSAPAGA